MDHVEEVLNQFQGREEKKIPEHMLTTIQSNLPEMLEKVSDVWGESNANHPTKVEAKQIRRKLTVDMG